MSGPKVVRVVTREELIAICRAHLARLDAALAAWTRTGRRSDTLSEAEVEAAQRRRDEIAALLEEDRFLDLQKAAQDEISFLAGDRQARLQKAALAEARARTAIRREQDAARAVLSALRRSGRAIPADLETALEEAARGAGDAASAVSAGFALMSQPSEADTSRLRELAKALKEDSPARRLETWLESQPPSPDEAALGRIEARLGELSALAGAHATASVEARLIQLRAGGDARRRRLLLDSLALDLGQTLAEARKHAEAQSRLEQALAELGSFDPSAVESLGANAGASLSEIEVQIAAVEAAIARARDAQAAAARRAAVLQALAGLGYEVGEELSTAWVQDGRVVLRRPAQPGYGVELTGGATADRLQMRVVAFGEGPADPARDRDAETLWCGDVSVLQERLASAGAALTIEKALPVGATPVKRISDLEDQSLAREGRAPQARTLG